VNLSAGQTGTFLYVKKEPKNKNAFHNEDHEGIEHQPS